MTPPITQVPHLPTAMVRESLFTPDLDTSLCPNDITRSYSPALSPEWTSDLLSSVIPQIHAMNFLQLHLLLILMGCVDKP